MAQSRRTIVAAMLLSSAMPAIAQGIGDPSDPATWRTPEFNAQWGLAFIGAEYAYARGLDGSGVRIGFVDSGLDINHPEFAGRYDPGISYDRDTPWSVDFLDHGTSVASVAAANRDGIGMHGVAPGATIVMAQEADAAGISNEKIDHALGGLVDRGVKIIVNSYGVATVAATDITREEFEYFRSDYLAIARKAVANDTLMIIATHNGYRTEPSYAAGLPYLFPELEAGWLAVAAVNPAGRMPEYSNYCGVAKNWCLAAPGGGPGWEWDPDIGDYAWQGVEDGILVAKSGGGYEKTLGTSYAAPHVAGAAALVAQAFPYMTMSQVRQVLLGTANDVGPTGVDEYYGYGLLDVGKAVLGPGAFDWGDFVANVPSGRSTWENDISGDGGLVKAGDGALILTGHSTYRGDTMVDQGVLAINGSIASQTFVGPDGMLSGIGTVHGDVRNDGAVYGGFSSEGGTLTIDGNYTQSADAALLVLVGAPQGTSRVDVTGSATVDGFVDAQVPMGSYQGDARYTVLTALGGISGRFGDDCGCYAFLDLKLSYEPTTVYLDVARNAVAFADVAASRNGAAVATAIEALGIGKPFYDLTVTLTGAEATSLFAQLPGEVHSSTVSGLIENSQLIGSQINDRLRSAFETVGALPWRGDDANITTAALTPAARYGAWGSAFGSWGSTGGDGNAGRLSRSTGGFVTGADGFVSGDWRLGFLAGYSHSSFKVEDRRSSASSENYHLGLYGGTQWGDLSLRSGLAYTWSEIDSGRQIAFDGEIASETSSHRAGTTQLFGELGYDMKAGTSAFEPFANLAYVSVRTSGFTEQGKAGALTVHGGSNDITFATLGLRAAHDFDIGAVKATARGMLGWRHAYGDVTPVLSQALAGTNAFRVAGAPVARDAAVIEAGFDFRVTPQATLGLSYQGQVAAQSRDHGFRADLSIKF